MYIWLLYIGLSATAVGYLYLTAIPYYAQQIQQGAQADESLWWQSVGQIVRHKPSKRYALRVISHTLFFAILLAVSALYIPWLAHAPLLNVVVMTVWLGGLVLLARIDYLCFLLPDVLTQFLLWSGLLLCWFLDPARLGSAVLLASTIYLGGRVLNKAAFFFIKRPLFGLGDVKLLAAIAVWLDAQSLLAVLFGACVLCLVLEAIRQRSWRPRGACAFGPYLVLATLLVWVWAYLASGPL